MAEVAELFRYPVKSLLGQREQALVVAASGVEGDRSVAYADPSTGLVATAKHPRLWRLLLQCHGLIEADGAVLVRLPDGRTLPVAESAGAVSAVVGRPVQVLDRPPDAAAVERPDPEDVIAQGDAAEVPAALLEIGGAADCSSFVPPSVLGPDPGPR